VSSLNYRSSRPDAWTSPRPYSDAAQRRFKYGPVQPMDQDRGFLWKLFHR
jgi:hypothetical protein